MFMKRGLMIKRIYIALALVWWTFSAQSQFLDKSKDWNFSENYRHWGFTMAGNLYPFTSTSEPKTGSLDLRWYYMWGFDLGLAYHIRLSNHWGIKLKLTAERMPVYSYRFYLPGDETTDGKSYFTTIPNRYAPWAFRLPVGMEYRFFTVPRYIFFLQGGVDVGYVREFFEAKAHNAYLGTAFADTGRRFRLDPYVAFGWYYLFPWAMWETGIVYRYHPGAPYFNGAYAVGNLQKTSSFGGHISQPGHYIGLRFIWYPHRRNRHAGTECPGQVHSKQVLQRRRMEEKAQKRAEKILKKERKRALKHQKRMKPKRKRKKRFLIF